MDMPINTRPRFVGIVRIANSPNHKPGWQVKDGSATLADVKGKNADALRAHLEGDYEKK